MSGKQLPIYRTSNPNAIQVGRARVVKDRNAKYYVNESRVEQISTRGEFSRLTCADGNDYIVRTSDLEQLTRPKA